MSTWRLPPALAPGACIGLAALSNWVEPEAVSAFESWLHQQGYCAKRASNLFRRYRSFAGSHPERAAGFRNLLVDPTVAAIWFVRGGYGASHALRHIADSELLEHPKWLIGFSDLTALHLRCARLGLCSLHADMPARFQVASLENFEATLAVLQGSPIEHRWTCTQAVRPGHAVGRLMGGNLSLLAHVLGGPDEPDTRGALLLLEEVDEYHYALDRLCLQLELAGKFSGVEAYLWGAPTLWQDNLDRPYGELALETLAPAQNPNGIIPPAVQQGPFGHGLDNSPLILGYPAELIITPNGKATLLQGRS